MNGETLFRALVAAREQVINIGLGWTKGDTTAVSTALLTGSWRMMPRKLRDLLQELADELQRATT